MSVTSILITGASSGIGAATARELAREFPAAKLMLTGRRQDRLEKICAEIGQDRAKAFTFDIRVRSQVEKFVKENEADLKNLSVLINNAGLAAGLASFQDASLEDWEAMIDTNLKGLLYITRAILPFMIKNKEGHIVNLGSIAGREVYPKGHVYNATKFAVRALNEGLRIDTLGSGVRVTSIDPGMVETEFSLVRFKGDQEKAKSVYAGMKPLRAEDIAEAIAWSLKRPKHVNVQEILLMPTDQASVRDVHRGGV